jgi:hypothetical protein
LTSFCRDFDLMTGCYNEYRHRLAT